MGHQKVHGSELQFQFSTIKSSEFLIHFAFFKDAQLLTTSLKVGQSQNQKNIFLERISEQKSTLN